MKFGIRLYGIVSESHSQYDRNRIMRTTDGPYLWISKTDLYVQDYYSCRYKGKYKVMNWEDIPEIDKKPRYVKEFTL